MTSSATDKKLEIDKKLENKLEIYKNLEIKLEIYSYFKLENKLEIFEFFVNGRWSQYKSVLKGLPGQWPPSIVKLAVLRGMLKCCPNLQWIFT